MPSTSDHVARSDRRNGAAVPVGILCALFVVLVWPAIFLGAAGTSEASDQREYHLPVVLKMAEQWPQVDIVNYRSTTSPGYHLALAVVVRYVTDSVPVLQLLSSLATLILALTVLHYATRGAGPRVGLVLTLPLVTSTYVVGGAIWLTTDNAALAFVAIAFGGAVFGSTRTSATVARGVLATGATFIRQIHIWVTAPAAIAALLSSPLGRRLPAPLRGETRTTWTGTILGGATLLVPFLLLAWLVSKWGGLTPPEYATLHDSGVNPANLAVILALFGGFGFFFLPAMSSAPAQWLSTGRWGALVFAIVLGICLTFSTSFDKEAGRWGGPIWEIVRVAPAIGTRSLILPPLAAFGGLVLLRAIQTAVAAGRGREVVVLLVGVAGWTAAQMVNAQAWQRYCEPMVLITLAWITALAMSGSEPGPRRWSGWWVGPALLALLHMVLLVRHVYLPV